MAALQVAGFADVKSMAGGMNAWTAAELPVVTD
jgi:rhodanese-related sulfurtransferase